MRIGILLAKIIVSFLLIISILAFVGVYSVSRNIDSGLVESTVSGIASEQIADGIAKSVSPEEDIDQKATEIHGELSEKCTSSEEIILGESGITVSCDDLQGIDPDRTEDFLKERLEERVGQEIEQKTEELGLAKYLAIIDFILMGLGILVLIFVAVIFFLNSPKYNFAVNLGLATATAGIPFVFIEDIGTNVADSAGYEILREIISGLSRELFVNLRILFITGALIFFSGVSWAIIAHNKKQAMNKTR